MILDIDDPGAAAKLRSQTFPAARYRVRRRVGTQEVGGVDWNPASESLDTLDGVPSEASGNAPGDDWPLLGQDGGSE